jgi:CRP-like cAMP-binding protein
MTIRQPICDDCPILDEGFLSTMDPDLLEMISREKVYHEFPAGQIIFYEGTPATHVYAIRSGMAKLYRTGSTGRDMVFRLVRSGEPMGHVSVLRGETYATTAQAVQPTGACVLPRRVFLDVLARSPRQAFRFLTMMASELLDREERLAVQSHQNAQQRAAGLILRLAESAPRVDGALKVDLPLKRSELADMISTTPETLSRILRILEREGLIRQRRTAIHILDEDRLRKVVEERD